MAHNPRYREAGVLFVMRRRRAVLHREIWNGTERYWLSTGVNIRTAVGKAVVESEHVEAGNDGLFAEAGYSQTFRFKAVSPASDEPPAHGSACVSRQGAPRRRSKMDARKYFGVTFVTLKDLADGPLQAVIDKVEEGKYGKLNLVFEDSTAASLNATNSRALVKVFGPNTDNWLGHVVELSADELEYQGKAQPAILIKPISAPVTATTTAEPAQPAPAPRHNSDMDDDIPF